LCETGGLYPTYFLCLTYILSNTHLVPNMCFVQRIFYVQPTHSISIMIFEITRGSLWSAIVQLNRWTYYDKNFCIKCKIC
jgi:hypothetical protein